MGELKGGRMSFIKYIADENHYKEVLSLVEKAKRTVWIGTADIKDPTKGTQERLAYQKIVSRQ